jgi:hypothetical protein
MRGFNWGWLIEMRRFLWADSQGNAPMMLTVDIIPGFDDSRMFCSDEGITGHIEVAMQLERRPGIGSKAGWRFNLAV